MKYIKTLTTKEEMASYNDTEILVGNKAGADVLISKLPTCADDEICYTSSGNVVVEPNSTDGFGANIVSNTNVDGKGVIKFDGPVTTFPNNVFHNKRLITMIIPNTVTYLGGASFGANQMLKKLIVPKGVTSMKFPTNATPQLESIVVSKENTTFDSRGYCNAAINSSTDEIVAACYKTVIPDEIKIIGSNSFNGQTQRTKVELPAGITSIDSQAFAGCTNLTTIIFKGTMAQWNAIKKQSDWNTNVPATVVNCSDGDVEL